MKSIKLLFVNFVTAFRIAAAVIVIALASIGVWWWVLVISIIGFLSDYLDGYLSRHWRVVSPFGMFFDPLTDKILCLAIIGILAVFTNPLFWIIFTVFALYDATTTTLRLALSHRLKMPAQKIAKIKTASQMIGLSLLLWGMTIAGQFHNFALVIGTIVLIFAAVLTLFSLYRYLRFVLTFLTKDRLELSPGVDRIDFKKWHDDFGIKAVLFDIEGTLTAYSHREVSDEMVTIIKNLRAHGIEQIGIVTNIHRRQSDRVEHIAKQLGIDLFRFPAGLHDRKPSRAMARSLLAEMGIDARHAAFVGDKLIDVVVGFRMHFPRVAWVERLGETDHLADRFFYRLVEKFLKKLIG